MVVDIKTSLKQKTILKGQLIFRLKFSAILNLSENEFARLIAEIERDPIMLKVLNPPHTDQRAIFRKRIPNTQLHSGFYEFQEQTTAAPQNVDLETLLTRHKGVLALVKKIGRENFERHFLYREDHESLESAARFSGVTLNQAKEIDSFLLDFSIHHDFFHPAKIPSQSGISYTVIAKIEKQEKESKFILSYLSPHHAQGRYVINREKLEWLKKSMNGSEKKELTQLLEKIEWINLRQDTIQKILTELIHKQKFYLQTGLKVHCLPVTQRGLSHVIKVAPSTVCRSIYAKSVLLPWGEEKEIKNLFLTRKEVVQGWISQLLGEMSETEREQLSDHELNQLLKIKYKLNISRRSINLYRRELE